MVERRFSQVGGQNGLNGRKTPRLRLVKSQVLHVDCTKTLNLLIDPDFSLIFRHSNLYPGWDSNPQQAGFEPTASANWATRAHANVLIKDKIFIDQTPIEGISDEHRRKQAAKSVSS